MQLQFIIVAYYYYILNFLIKQYYIIINAKKNSFLLTSAGLCLTMQCNGIYNRVPARLLYHIMYNIYLVCLRENQLLYPLSPVYSNITMSDNEEGRPVKCAEVLRILYCFDTILAIALLLGGDKV